MGVFDKFLNVMRLNSDEDEDDFYLDDEYDDEDYEEPAPKRKLFGGKSDSLDDDDFDEKSYDPPQKQPARSQTKITPMPKSKKGTQPGMEVCVFKPTTMEDAREIVETLLSNRTVVLNVEGLDIDIAQRIIDFTSGACFAIDGNLQKISTYIFVITPHAVDISGDFQNMIDSFDVSNMS